MRLNKKELVLVPSAYNSKVMGDIENFANLLKDKLNIIIISDKHSSRSVYKDDILYVKAGTSLARYYIYTADYLIDAGSVNRNSRVSSNQKRISVWHGTPYKNMFVDFDQKYLTDALTYAHTYDLMVSPSKYYSERFLRNSMCYSGDILEIGSSRIDAIIKTEAEIEALKSKLSLTGKKVVLYAPTFREPGKISLDLDFDKISAILGDDYVIAVKLHYLNELNQKSDNIVDLSDYANVNDLLAISDVLISDYSSLLFDYSVLNKPIILYQYDYSKYVGERGLMFNMEEYLESKFICYNSYELYEALNDLDSYNSSKLKDTFYPYETGHSTENIIKELDFDYSDKKLSEVIFLANDLNQIGGVHGVAKNLAKQFKAKYNCRIVFLATNEFNDTNSNQMIFDRENLFDIKVSHEQNRDAYETILKNTTGKVISLQFSAHIKAQEFLKNKDVTLMFHGDVKDVINRGFYHWHLDALNKGTIKNYSSLCTLTESNHALLDPWLEDKVPHHTYIENGYDFDLNNLYQKSGEFVALTRLDIDKNIFDLLTIFAHENINPNFKLKVYGDGPLKQEFANEIKKLNLEDKVLLMGYVESKEEVFANCQGLIMTSQTEGQPMVILEAINHGIPVYTFDSFTSVYDVVNEKVGAIIENKNINMYVEKLNEQKDFDFYDFKDFSTLFNNETILDKWDRQFNNYKEHKVIDELAQRKLEAKIFPLISIIVPFYNNADVIENALESLANQKYPNIEALVINDGSTFDESRIVKKYDFVRYFYKENEGLGLTRNFGISQAKGKYLFFMDSDDTTPEKGLLRLVNFAEKHNLDVVGGKTRRVNLANPKLNHFWYPDLYKEDAVIEKNQVHIMHKDTLSTNKMYNREALINSGILYETGLYEDKLFMSKIYSHFDQIGVINEHIYNWIIYGNNTSITTSLTYDNFYERYLRLVEIWSIIDDKGKYYYMNIAINHDFRIYVNTFTSYTDVEQFEMFKTMRSFVLGKEEYIYEKNIPNIVNLNYLKALLTNDFEQFKVVCSLHANSIVADNNKSQPAISEHTVETYYPTGKIKEKVKITYSENKQKKSELIYKYDETGAFIKIENMYSVTGNHKSMCQKHYSKTGKLKNEIIEIY